MVPKLPVRSSVLQLSFLLDVVSRPLSEPPGDWSTHNSHRSPTNPTAFHGFGSTLHHILTQLHISFTNPSITPAYCTAQFSLSNLSLSCKWSNGSASVLFNSFLRHFAQASSVLSFPGLPAATGRPNEDARPDKTMKVSLLAPSGQTNKVTCNFGGTTSQHVILEDNTGYLFIKIFEVWYNLRYGVNFQSWKGCDELFQIVFFCKSRCTWIYVYMDRNVTLWMWGWIPISQMGYFGDLDLPVTDRWIVEGT